MVSTLGVILGILFLEIQLSCYLADVTYNYDEIADEATLFLYVPM